MPKKISVVCAAILLMISLSGCIKLGGDKQTDQNLGGVFISADNGENWGRKVDLMTPGATPGTIGDVNVVDFTFDPSDSNVLYLSTAENGLFYSINNGNGWMPVDDLNSGFVRGVDVDSKNPCAIYVAINTRLVKSSTCAREWEDVFKVAAGQLVTAVTVDYYNSDMVYIGLDSGDFYKSQDAGKNWERLYNFPSRVNQIVLDKDDSRKLYVGTEKNYLYKSSDSGQNWQSLRDQLREFSNAGRSIEIAQSRQTGALLYATGYGILKSVDSGATWQEVKLLTEPDATKIFSMAINPKNGNEIYYATDTNYYRSADGGETWSASKLPTTRAGRALTVHPEDGNVIYLGVRSYEQ
ncbi:MAG TPA: hypothetical protein VMX18_01500 [Candidatus Bipolaricaulota bacterium]|nr:hypothetical protein [Candidatus Bipolaricaulota bacterium]